VKSSAIYMPNAYEVIVFVCRRAHVLFTFFVGGFMSYLPSVVYRRVMSYLRYLCLFA
jgi:hypothetical protein